MLANVRKDHSSPPLLLTSRWFSTDCRLNSKLISLQCFSLTGASSLALAKSTYYTYRVILVVKVILAR